jgi:Domain of unknown function (DUF4328)
MRGKLPYRLPRLTSILEAINLGQIVFAVATVLAIGCGLLGLLPSFVTLLPQLVIGWIVTVGLGTVLLLVWMHHAAANAAVLAPDPRRIRPWMAVIWWFVPVFNLWQPIRCMSQIWNTSVDADMDLNGPAAPPVTLWWLLLLFTPVPVLGTPPTAMLDGHDLAFSVALSAASTAAQMTIIRQVTRGQLAKAGLGATDRPEPDVDTLPAAALK